MHEKWNMLSWTIYLQLLFSVTIFDEEGYFHSIDLTCYCRENYYEIEIKENADWQSFSLTYSKQISQRNLIREGHDLAAVYSRCTSLLRRIISIHIETNQKILLWVLIGSVWAQKHYLRRYIHKDYYNGSSGKQMLLMHLALTKTQNGIDPLEKEKHWPLQRFLLFYAVRPMQSWKCQECRKKDVFQVNFFGKSALKLLTSLTRAVASGTVIAKLKRLEANMDPLPKNMIFTRMGQKINLA